MGFDSRFATAWAAVSVAVQGEDVLYTPGTGSPKTIKALVQRETHQDLKASAETLQHDEIVVVIRNDATLGVANPVDCGSDNPDRVTVDGVIYWVADVVERDVAGEHRLLLSTKMLPRRDM